jgi:hypothetical protein
MMDDAFSEAIEYRGFNINIHQDQDPAINPIDDFDMFGTMACWHSRYTLGHKQPDCEPKEFLQRLAIEADPYIENRIEYWENGIGWRRLSIKYPSFPIDPSKLDLAVNECEQRIDSIIEKAINQYYIMLPLYLYDHSGITISTGAFNCPWDSGQIGYIYVTKEAIKKEFTYQKVTKKARQKAIDIMQLEVKTYDQYLTGSVYGYVIEPTDKNKSIECDDSCWGFFGYDHEKSGLMEMAKNSIDCAIKQYKKDCKAEHKKRRQMNQFMQTSWAI